MWKSGGPTNSFHIFMAMTKVSCVDITADDRCIWWVNGESKQTAVDHGADVDVDEESHLREI